MCTHTKACSQKEISHAATFNALLASRGFRFFLPFPHPFVLKLLLWCLHGFNQPRDLQECIVGCIYTPASTLSIHIRLRSALRGENKEQGPILRLEFFNGLMLGHESTPFPERLREDIIRILRCC